jgi:UDP-glucuronate decarboxylase
MNLVLDSDIEEISTRISPTLKKLEGKQVLITGAAGFLGRYFMSLFHLLNEKSPGNPVTIVALDSYITSSNATDQPWQKTSPNIEWIFGDAEIGSQLPNKFDYIIHAAGIASPQHYRANPLLTIDVAVNVTRKLLEKAKNDSSRFLFFSSSEIYGDPFEGFVPTPEDYRGNVSTRGPRACYDESKRLGETLCWVYQTYFNVHACIARPFNIYGPGMMPQDYRVLPNFAAAIARGETLKVYGHGLQTRTFCYVTDAICGFMKILIDTVEPDVFNVGNSSPEISMQDLASLTSKISGRKLAVELVKYPSLYPEDEPNRRCPNINKIQSTLDFVPLVELEEGLSRFLRWANANYSDEILK